MQQIARADNEWRQGWRPLVAAFVGTGISWNVTLILAGLFLKSMQEDLTWPRTELAFGPLAGVIVTLILPFSGIVIDRFGARATAITGTVALASAYLLLAAMPPVRAFYFGSIVYLACAGALCNSIIFSRGLTDWFDKRLATAIGIMITGSAVAGAIVTPLLAKCIKQFGWRMGFVSLATGMLVVGLPFILGWFRTSDRPADINGEAIRPIPFPQLVRRTEFWMLGGVTGIAALPIGGFLQHLVPLLSDRGLSASTASLGSIFALSIGIGSIAIGALMDRLNAFVVCALSFILAALSVCVLTQFAERGASWSVLALSIALIGASIGAEGDAISVFSMRLFGITSYARVASVMAMTMSGGMALGGLLFARAYDLTGSYRIATNCSVACFALAGVIFLSMRQWLARSYQRSDDLFGRV